LKSLFGRAFAKIISQKTIPWIGGLKDIFVMVAFYMSIINFTLVAITAYNTGIRDWLIQHGLHWIKVYIWLGFMAIIALVAMLIEYKIVYPSFYAFRSRQEYKHESPFRKLQEEILKKQEEILKKQENIEKRLDELEGKGGRKDS